jgi:hypothetical protein
MRLELQVLARENFTKWNEALQTKDPLKVARMYSRSDLSFLPTVSPKHIKGLEATEYYFEKFVLKNPFGTITDDQVCLLRIGSWYSNLTRSLSVLLSITYFHFLCLSTHVFQLVCACVCVCVCVFMRVCARAYVFYVCVCVFYVCSACVRARVRVCRCRFTTMGTLTCTLECTRSSWEAPEPALNSVLASLICGILLRYAITNSLEEPQKTIDLIVFPPIIFIS